MGIQLIQTIKEVIGLISDDAIHLRERELATLDFGRKLEPIVIMAMQTMNESDLEIFLNMIPSNSACSI